MPRTEAAADHDPRDGNRHLSAEQASLSGAGLPSVPSGAPARAAEPENEIVIVDSAKGLKKLAGMLGGERIVGLDTETAFFDVSDRGDKGKLALIQLSLPAHGLTVLVDPIEQCDESSRDIVYRDLRPLRRALENPALEKVAHSAGFDKKVLESVGIDVPEIIDTQSLLRQVRPDIKRSSLRVACRYVLGLEVDKEQQTSAWHTRPLSAEQVKYAALDPELALRLYDALRGLRERAAWVDGLSIEGAMSALNGKLRDLDRLLDREAPELRLWEAKEAALTDELRKRHPGGSAGYSGPDGSVYPGELQQEVDVAGVRRHFAGTKMTKKQRALLTEALDSITSIDTSKGRIVSALKAIGPKNLGFRSAAAMEKMVSEFQTARNEPGAKIEPAYRPVAAEAPTIDPQADDASLMAELSGVSKAILTTFRDRLPEVPALRYEIKALYSRVESLARESATGFDGDDGKVTFKRSAPAIDVDKLRLELPERLAGHMDPAAVDALLESVLTERIPRASLAEMLREPRMDFLGYGEDAEELWSAVLVPANRYNPTRVAPEL